MRDFSNGISTSGRGSTFLQPGSFQRHSCDVADVVVVLQCLHLEQESGNMAAALAQSADLTKTH